MEEPRFVRLQRRRGSTEGRIGVLKNRWHGGKIRSKGFDNRNLSVAWSVLSHNLWKIAQRLAQEHEKEDAGGIGISSQRRFLGRTIDSKREEGCWKGA